MATKRTMQSGDTWPPLRGLASDEDGPVDLTVAVSMRAMCKSSTHLIELPAEVIDPIEIVNEGEPNEEQYNWQADLVTGDTDIIGNYVVQLEVTWEAGRIETFPNSRAGAPILAIELAND